MLDSIARVLADDAFLREPRERIEKAKQGLNRKTVGLALGSGAARGLAHIGVIKVLEDSGIFIDAIVGCSAGALVGGAYACGMSTRELIEQSTAIRQADIIRYLDLGITSRSGFLRGSRINKLLMKLTNNATFAATRMPFVAIATNVKTGEERAFDSGPVWKAIRASISIPGIFVPQKIDEEYYVDGAVSNPVPSDYLTAMGLDIVIGVDIVPDVAKSGIKGSPNLVTVLLNSFDIFQERLVKMVIHHMDVKIRPAIEGVLAHEFYRAEELIDLGQRAAMEALDDISALLEQ